MVRNTGGKNVRTFTVELSSRRCLDKASLGVGSNDDVLIEGRLGELQSVGFLDGVVLEIVGTEGVLRVDLFRGEIEEGRELSPQKLHGLALSHS